MPPRRGKPQGAKEPPEEPRPRTTSSSSANEKPKASEGGSAWGKPREIAPVRANAAPSAAASSPASSAASAKAKAAAAAKTPVNIAALAARNLGGFVPNKIFVGGVPNTCTEEQFRSYFEPYGAISKVELHALRGFGYITYESAESVDSCLEKYEDHYLSKRWVEVKRSIPRELIDAYEREQRKLHAEHLGSGEVERATAETVDIRPKVEAPSPPTATALPSLPSSAPRRGPQHKEPPSTVVNSRVAQLREMGFSDEVARRVLGECVWDVNEAIDRLLASGAMCGEEDGSQEETGGVSPASANATATTTASDGPTAGSAAGCGTSATSEEVVAAGNLPATVETHPAPEEASLSASAAPAANGIDAVPALDTEECREGALSSGVSSTVLPSTADGPSTTSRAESAILAYASAPAVASTASTAAGEPVDSTTLPASVPVTAEPAPETVTEANECTASVEVTENTVIEEQAATPTMPCKRIERAMRTWSAEDTSQLSVSERQFVKVWVGTSTENGWCHAEAHSDSTQVGWLPACVLQQLPEGQRWMQARRLWQAMDESQCSVDEGAVVIVWLGSRTKEGWTYVEAERNGAFHPGWLPVFCLDWCED